MRLCIWCHHDRDLHDAFYQGCLEDDCECQWYEEEND